MRTALDLENLNDSPRSAFLYLAQEISELGRLNNIRITPFRDERLPYFSALARDRQLDVIRDLNTYLAISRETLAMGKDLADAPAMTWNAIKHFGYRPTSDLFSFITGESVIEVHDGYGIQVFRNFNFYNYCSYSLEELYSFAWNHLYTRDEQILAQLLKIVGTIYAGESKNTIKTNLPRHIIEELYSPFRYKIKAEVKYVSPLFDASGRPVATVAIETGELDGVPLTPQEEETILSHYDVSEALLRSPEAN